MEEFSKGVCHKYAGFVSPIDLLSGLNDQQRQVVTTAAGPVLALAGAGSGKTKAIIHRAAWMIKELKVPPWNLLIVTFTNRAAQELITRLQQILGFNVSALWVGTFHSICVRILRFEAAHLPFNSNFSIYDDDDQKSLLKKIYKQHGYDKTKLPIPRILNTISRFKNKLMLPEDISESDAGDGLASLMQRKIYELYQQNLLLNQALDFDDILLYTARLLRDNDTIRRKYQQQFPYVMIDEYQDTNYAQFQIVYQIARYHRNVCVVGDDDQAIYSWRGATIRNILEFERDYGKINAIKLEQNYRSTTRILDLANDIIKHNRKRHSKNLWSDLGQGDLPELHTYEDETDEANRTVLKVKELSASGIPLRDIAILYRTNAQSRVFEYALTQHQIPYSIVGSLYFYQRKEIKDMLAYLRVIDNPQDNENLLRIINEPPRGIGQTTITRIISHAAKLHIPLFTALGNSATIPDLQSRTLQRIGEFYARLIRWRSMALESPVLSVVKTILEELEWLEHYQRSQDPKDISRAENLSEFVSSVSEFTDHFQVREDRVPLLTDYLPYISLQTDLDRLSDSRDTLRLMTMHNAKGLEFDSVFIAGMEDELLPHRMSMDSAEEMEEERRLFYVGVTRAKRRLYLSHVRFRRIYDTYYHPTLSCFVNELDPSLLRLPGQEDILGYVPRPKKNRPRKVITESMKHYRIGQPVYHDEYGEGTILSVDGVGSSARLTISFKGGKLAKIIGSFIKTRDEV